MAKALLLLKNHLQLKALSTLYRTAPLGKDGQPPFINGVALAETILSPGKLKSEVLRKIERDLGRRRSSDRYAPRPIDLDIILFDDLVDGEMGLPDPDIYRRPFIAIPLLEIGGDLLLPDSGMTLREVASRMAGADMEPLFELTEKLRKAVNYERGKS